MVTIHILLVLLVTAVAEGQWVNSVFDVAGALVDSSNIGNFDNTIENLLSSISLLGNAAASGTHECTVKPDEDADACRNVSEIIRSRGFEVKEYNITTPDGYIIGIQQVINPLVDPADRNKRRPVILEPGFQTSSVDYCIDSVYARPTRWSSANETEDIEDIDMGLSEEEEDRRYPRSLSYYLANRGYNVFVSNYRGNIYGQTNVNKTVDDPSFWDFSIDEQIDIDLPLKIDLLQRVTGHKKVAYVGWSQGAMTMFGLLASRPEYAEIIEPFIAMAPTVFYSNVTSSLNLIFPAVLPASNVNAGLLYNDQTRYLIRQICDPTQAQLDFCVSVLFSIFGANPRGLQEERLPTFLHFVPAGTSLKNFIQYAQNHYAINKFIRYDFGTSKNQEVYGQPTPPEYDITQIRSKSIALFAADNDLLANPKDIENLVATLGPNLYEFVNMTEVRLQWNHIDFLHHIRSGVLINPRITKVLDRFTA